MKKIITLIVILLAYISVYAENRHLLVYRNDSNFNQMTLKDKCYVTHSCNESGNATAHINDIIKGDTQIPLSTIDSCILRDIDIPILRFTFPEYPEAECLWNKDLYVEANLEIEGNGYCDDVQDLSLKVKGRGNSTWNMPKKPMRLKFPKKLPYAV